MDLSMLDWVVVIVVLLLLVVGLDGYRRAQRERRNRVRISKNAKRSFESDNGPGFPSELPNGGARMVGKREFEAIDPRNPPEIVSEYAAYQQKKTSESLRAERAKDQGPETELDPLFVDPIEYAKAKQKEAEQLAQDYMQQSQPEAANQEHAADVADEPQYNEPELTAEPEYKVGHKPEYQPEQNPEQKQEQEQNREHSPEYQSDTKQSYQPEPVQEPDLEQQQEPKPEANKAIELAFKAKDWANKKMAAKDIKSDGAHEPQPAASKDPDDIIILHVLAKDTEGFIGRDLTHILFACDCRFGEMNIFHRYEGEDASGEIQFSIVNRLKPGSFDLDAIDDFKTPGISFFLRLPGPKDPFDAFTCMEATAKAIAKSLGGILKDEQLSTVTEQTLEHCRERISLHKKQQLIKH